MTIEELLIFGKSHCHSDHAKILLAELIEKNPLELLTCLEEQVPTDKQEIYKQEVIALQEGKPLQYVLGKVNFHGIKYYVDERVLIPRFETEELVENTINYINKFFTEPVDIIDLGTGSGVIGLTLESKVKTNNIDLVDISKEALEVTKINKDNLNSKANIIENDMLEGISKKYDVIISNPPYIRDDEEIEEIVKKNEPNQALYGGKDGLDYYKKILETVKNNMKDKCLIAFEIGEKQADDIKEIIKNNLEDVTIEVKKDLSDRDRMIFIFKGINK